MSIIGDINSIKNGVIDAYNTVNSYIEDNRDPNTQRARQEAEDPTEKIDSANNVSILNFPHDRPKYFISFGFQEYRRPSQFQGLKTNGITDYIALPMPSNLDDTSTFNYSAGEGSFVVDSLSSVLADKVDKFSSTNGDITEKLTGLLKSFNVNDLEKGSQAAMGYAVRNTLEGAKSAEKLIDSTGFSDAVLATLGLADNPMAAVTFKGPNFKQHSFSWRLSAKSSAESDTITKIINTFKRVAHPELLNAGAGGFYKYPYIVLPKFHPEEVIGRMYAFKPCVITSISANYAPNSLPGFFANSNAPVEVILRIGLMEIELWRNGTNQKFWDNKNGTILPTIGDGDFNNIDLPPARNLGTI